MNETKKPRQLRIFLAKRTTRKGGIVGRQRGRQLLPGSHSIPAGRKPNGAFEWDTALGRWLNSDGSTFIPPPSKDPPANVVGWDARQGEWIYTLPKRQKQKHRAPSKLVLTSKSNTVVHSGQIFPSNRRLHSHAPPPPPVPPPAVPVAVQSSSSGTGKRKRRTKAQMVQARAEAAAAKLEAKKNAPPNGKRKRRTKAQMVQARAEAAAAKLAPPPPPQVVVAATTPAAATAAAAAAAAAATTATTTTTTHTSLSLAQFIPMLPPLVFNATLFDAVRRGVENQCPPTTTSTFSLYFPRSRRSDVVVASKTKAIIPSPPRYM